jgi:hypothetical protein
MKDFWTLHVPLVLVLTLSITATVIEYRRAGEGVARAWAYTFQWPIIGIFGVIVWNRYRRHGNLTRWFVTRYRERITAFQDEDRQREAREAAADRRRLEESTPEALAWREYVSRLEGQVVSADSDPAMRPAAPGPMEASRQPPHQP